MSWSVGRRALLTGATAATVGLAAGGRGRAQAGATIRIGVLTAMTGR